jgi:hypothetical protein
MSDRGPPSSLHEQHRARFSSHLRANNFRPFSSSSFGLHQTKDRSSATITDQFLYPNHEQQQPRVHRAKSECHHVPITQPQRSRSTANPFQKFSPIQLLPTIIHRHFIPFRSAPFLSTSTTHSTAPMFYPNQKQQFGRVQLRLGLLNSYRFGSTRF